MPLPGLPGRYRLLHGAQEINQRDRPTLAGTIIGEIPSDVIVEVTVEPFRDADTYTWINVTYLDQTGWIAAQDHVQFVDLRGHDMVRYWFGNLDSNGGKSRIWKLNTTWAGDGELIQIQREGGRYFTVKGHQRTDCNFESRYISAGFIHLDYDTSPGGGTVYHMLTNQRLMPRFMAVGDPFLIEDVFEWLDKTSGAVIPGRESVYFPHYVELVAVHEHYTFPSGITLQDVAEVRSFFPDGSPFERAWYANGLVGWKDESGSGKHSWFNGYVDGPDMQRERLAWLEPQLQPIPDPDPVAKPPPAPEPEADWEALFDALLDLQRVIFAKLAAALK